MLKIKKKKRIIRIASSAMTYQTWESKNWWQENKK